MMGEGWNAGTTCLRGATTQIKWNMCALSSRATVTDLKLGQRHSPPLLHSSPRINDIYIHADIYAKFYSSFLEILCELLLVFRYNKSLKGCCVSHLFNWRSFVTKTEIVCMCCYFSNRQYYLDSDQLEIWRDPNPEMNISVRFTHSERIDFRELYSIAFTTQRMY